MVSAPSTFTNAANSRVDDNYCLSSYIELTGTSDTSGLSDAQKSYTDGYKGKFTLALDMLLPGAAGGWRGICIVYYSAQYVMDATNGSLCAIAKTSTATGAGGIDFGATTLHKIPNTTWMPPAKSASVTTSTGLLSDAKYGIVYSPTATTARLYTDGHFTTATFYMPKKASSYTDFARFGKDNYAGIYCL